MNGSIQAGLDPGAQSPLHLLAPISSVLVPFSHSPQEEAGKIRQLQAHTSLPYFPESDTPPVIFRRALGLALKVSACVRCSVLHQ